MSLFKKIAEAKKAIKTVLYPRTRVGIVLGTGLSGLAKRIEKKRVVPYDVIPHFPHPTGAEHKAEVYTGYLGGKPVVAFGGRFHIYEGYSLEAITLPVRVAKALGVKVLILSNAAGGLNPLFSLSDLMLITDHINFTGLNPLIGPNDARLGPRFPDMSEPYDRKLTALFEEAALKKKQKVQRGVYLGVTGPCLETAAEYRAFRSWGADAIGMSTIAEVIVAKHAGLRVLGISIITDLCLPDALEPAKIEVILKTAAEGERKLTFLLEAFLSTLRL